MLGLGLGLEENIFFISLKFLTDGIFYSTKFSPLNCKKTSYCQTQKISKFCSIENSKQLEDETTEILNFKRQKNLVAKSFRQRICNRKFNSFVVKVFK